MRCASAGTIEKQDVEREHLASVTVLRGGPVFLQSDAIPVIQPTRRARKTDLSRCMSDGDCKAESSGETQHANGAAGAVAQGRRMRGRGPQSRSCQARLARRRPVLPYRADADAPVRHVPLPRRRQKGGIERIAGQRPDGTSELEGAGEQTTAASISDQRQGERRVK